MRHCKEVFCFFSVFLLVHAPLCSPAASQATHASDTVSNPATRPVRGDSAVGKSAAEALATSGHRGSVDTAKGNVSAEAKRDSLIAHARDALRSLGKYHNAMGIYNIATGVLAVCAGVAILDKQDIFPFSISLITLGGITMGIGIWEINLGCTLSR